MQDNFLSESQDYQDIFGSELSKQMPSDKITEGVKLQNMVQVGKSYDSEMKDIQTLNKKLGVGFNNNFSVKSTISKTRT